MKTLKRILWLLLLFIILGIATAFGYYYAVTKDFSLQPDKLVFTEKNILLFDVNGQEIKNSSLFFSKQAIRSEEIPSHVKQAFIATEDKRFYQHNGFDSKRILGATLHNLKSFSLKEGASTISQQLIKNTHLSQEKTFKRKLREWKLTRALENEYSKDEILERYLNTIYFGHSCFGIKSAAEFYFGKDVSELSVADSAILAALVKAPNNYSPFRHPEKCAARKTTVLRLMKENKCITELEMKKAMNEPLPTYTQQDNWGYFRFVFDELSHLSENHAFHVSGKVEIYTYLDIDVQNELEKLAKTETNCDKAFIVLNNETMGFNGALSTVQNAQRLPGSLIKPLLIYAPALEENILSPATPILDEKINYGNYSPENYDGKYYGYVSVRECVEKSLNVPAVKTLQTLGIDKARRYMEKMNLKIEKEDESLALALGGMKKGYTLQDITTAYATLANSGNYEKGAFISKINRNGETVYQRKRAQTPVFSEDSAYLMTDMLRTTAQRGTAKKLHSLPFDVAAKTGTVGNKHGNTDAYAISYTQRNCVSVWLGNADNTKIEYTGGSLPCNFLQSIHEHLYAREKNTALPYSKFTKPDNVQEIKLDSYTYYASHTLSIADELAPTKYTFSELFKTSAIPLNKSTSFSHPTLKTPTISLTENNVTILFAPDSPTYYSYKIERSDYASHTTIYQGSFTPSFTDCIQSGKHYVYTVTPIYQNYVGTPIVLPAVYAQKSAEKKEEVFDSNWWE